MAFYLTKILVSALFIFVASEVAKRNKTLGALIISLPMVSMLTFAWLYIETKDAPKIASLSHTTLLLIIPSLLFFVLLPICIRQGWNFWLSFVLSLAATAAAYLLFSGLLSKLGVKL